MRSAIVGLVRLEEEEAAVMINRELQQGGEEHRGAQPANPPHTPQSVTPPPTPAEAIGFVCWLEGRTRGNGEGGASICSHVHAEKNKELVVLLRKTNRENYMKPHGALKKQYMYRDERLPSLWHAGYPAN
jgi:hypothetical protein